MAGGGSRPEHARHGDPGRLVIARHHHRANAGALTGANRVAHLGSGRIELAHESEQSRLVPQPREANAAIELPALDHGEGEHAQGVESDVDVLPLLQAAALCNDAQLLGPDDSDPRWRAIGDPTEAALLTLAVKGGLVLALLRERLPRRREGHAV
jgi:magnesium-transporting ATPase (P-type)